MAYDIYGNNLRPGHCEAHPHIHEEYPCSTCLAESRQRQQPPEYDKVGEMEHYLWQAQQEIERLTAELVRTDNLWGKSHAEVERLTAENKRKDWITARVSQLLKGTDRVNYERAIERAAREAVSGSPAPECKHSVQRRHNPDGSIDCCACGEELTPPDPVDGSHEPDYTHYSLDDGL